MTTERKFVATAAVAVAFASGVLLSRSIDRRMALTADPPPQTGAASAQTRNVTGAAGLPDLSAIAERGIQASVNISSTEVVQVDPFLQFFYGADPTEPHTSLGSGVVVSADGYILTNSHVVGNPRSEIHVTTSDDREVPARVIGIDTISDLAVIKADLTKAAPLPWGDSDRLKSAEWVLAIGNPFRFNQTVTLGVVSAPKRRDPQLDTYTDFVQIDAAINPGNSGGALVNARGELVGINTMIYGPTGGFQGIGFAIPANAARRVMDLLIKDGQVTRGSIGSMSLRSITAAQARENNLGDRAGMFVARLSPAAPAARAGLRAGDVIVGFNGQPVVEQSQFARAVADAPVGSTAKLDVMRAGKPVTLNVTIGRLVPPAVRR
jgi:S1-C subfamily serine protease